jgi:hypothetical protein
LVCGLTLRYHKSNNSKAATYGGVRSPSYPRRVPHYDLENAFWYENEIKTGVGAAAGLPPNAIGNVTEPNHILHDTDGPGFGACPKPVAGAGSGPVNECSQVYREPFENEGKIKMRTRGFGDNQWGVFNDFVGPKIFKGVDQDMIDALEASSDGLCPSL